MVKGKTKKFWILFLFLCISSVGCALKRVEDNTLTELASYKPTSIDDKETQTPKETVEQTLEPTDTSIPTLLTTPTPPTDTPIPPYSPERPIENGSGDEILFVLDFNELGDRENCVYNQSHIEKYDKYFIINNRSDFINLSFKEPSDEGAACEMSDALRIYSNNILYNNFKVKEYKDVLIEAKTNPKKIIAVQVYFSIHNDNGTVINRNDLPWESYFFIGLNCNGNSTEIMHGRFGDYFYDFTTKPAYEKNLNMRVRNDYPENWSDASYFVARYSFEPHPNSDYQKGNVYIQLSQSDYFSDVDILTEMPEGTISDVRKCELFYDDALNNPVQFGVRQVRQGTIDVRIYKIIFWLKDN